MKTSSTKGYILSFRQSLAYRLGSVAIGFIWFFSVELSQSLHALTSGPAQPEAFEFTPAGVSDLVDPFTGDFSYNIPLLDIGGYPINLAYSAGASMDQEATWVGLGWNVNTGAINRSVRGLPDDFNRDTIVSDFNIRENITVSASGSVSLEAIGKPLPMFGIGTEIVYNNYSGLSISTSLTPTFTLAKAGKKKLNLSLGLKSGGGGLDISPSLNLATVDEKNARATDGKLSLGLGVSYNSRNGLQGMSFGPSLSTGYVKRMGKVKPGESKIKKRSDGLNMGSSMSFAAPSVVPKIQYPFENFSFTFRGSLGAGVFGADADFALSGGYFNQRLRYHVKRSPGYGYMNLEHGQSNPHARLDFSRDKDGSYSLSTPYLAQASLSHDIYTIDAQGLGGTFRPFRNDQGFIFDEYESNPSASGALNLELSAGNVVNFGGEFELSMVNAQTKAWSDGNLASPSLRYQRKKRDDLREPWHFRLSNEMATEIPNGFMRGAEGYQATYLENAGVAELKPLWENGKGGKGPLSNVNQRAIRQTRKTHISYFTVGQVRKMYPHMTVYLHAHMPSHHIAAIIITNTEGKRYVFGAPAINWQEQQMSFSMGRTNPNTPLQISANGMQVSYTPSDRSTQNKRGIDHFFDRTTTPAYVYAWQLTEVLSPDYVDITGNGPSEDDLGTYTKFSYGTLSPNGRRLPNLQRYKWRTPTSKTPLQAGYAEGLKTDISDDKAHISYGEKDIWYLNSIESKTQVAVFQLSDRADGFGVTGLDGQVGGSPQKKIDRIDLYAKEEYTQLGVNAIPLKSVHFKYDYSLCQGTPNNLNIAAGTTGKLTLKEVFFTYKQSGRSKFSPYRFTYSSVNPDYAQHKTDRWGNYQSVTPPNLSYHDYSYTHQDKTVKDQDAHAWNLIEVRTPAGGKIQVEYASDSYSYVQDKQASRMFMVKGFSSDVQQPTQGVSNSLQTFNSTRLLMHLDLAQEAISGTLSQSQANDIFWNRFVKGWQQLPKGPTEHLYFRFLINVGPAISPKYEYVSGYVELDLGYTPAFFGVYKHGSSQYNRAWLKVKSVNIDSPLATMNPFGKAAIQFSRINTPRYAFNQPDPSDPAPVAMIKILMNANILNSLLLFFQGPNGSLFNQGFGNRIVPDQSWVRLFKPNGGKLGGGHRVAKVTISDDWAQMEPAENMTSMYGQVYQYQQEDGTCSGVAAWEPSVGADENTHRVPIFYAKENLLAPDEKFYLEEPLFESQFPGPQVGYERVVVKSLPHAQVNVNATGHVVHTFYTAKDFPTRVQAVKSQPRRSKITPLFSLLFAYSQDYISDSQGFYVELNDMHGKPKSTFAYPEGSSTPITGTTYHYQTNPNGTLNSMVNVFNEYGMENQQEIGVDVDVLHDFREHNTQAQSVSMPLNLAFFTLAIFPILIPTAVPKVSVENTRFRLSSSNKIVRRAGILHRTESFDLGAKVNSVQEGYDARTGDVLLTRVNNEFQDSRYSAQIPAYWAYPRMGFISENWGYTFSVHGHNLAPLNWDYSTGKILSTAHQRLIAGDEISMPFPLNDPHMISAGGSTNAHTFRLWVSQDASGDKYLIDAAGRPFTFSNHSFAAFTGVRQMQVIRSGNRNYPVSPIQSIETMQRPVVGGNLAFTSAMGVLSASGMEFDEFWKNNDNRLYSYQDTLGYNCRPYPEMLKLIQLWNFILDQAQNSPLPLPLLQNTNAPVEINLSTLVPSSYIQGLPGWPSTCDYYFIQDPVTAPNPRVTMGFYDPVSQTFCSDPCYAYFNFLDANTAQPLNANQLLQLGSFSEDYVHVNPTLFPSLYSMVQAAAPNIVDLFVLNALNQDGSPMTLFFAFDNCDLQTMECTPIIASFPCMSHINQMVNPYLYGFLGNWRPFRNYTYLSERTPDISSGTAVLRSAGTFASFSGALWAHNTGSPLQLQSHRIHPTMWKWASEITNFNQYGQEIENMDALQNFSAALFGYKHTLPIAVAKNARYKEIAFDGFEDYYPGQLPDSCDQHHFKFSAFKHLISAQSAHSGRFSMKIPQGTSIFVQTLPTPWMPRRNNYAVPYFIQPNDLLGFWSPELGTGQSFVCSFWVKKDGSHPFLLSYQNEIAPNFQVNSTTVIPSTLTFGPMIEGWQQVYMELTFPALNAGDVLKFELSNQANTDYYFDDFRTHPINAQMQSFVYDRLDFQYMAQLDENNFATFYEYDSQGHLIRVKKETIRGIMTIEEKRQHQPKP